MSTAAPGSKLVFLVFQVLLHTIVVIYPTYQCFFLQQETDEKSDTP